MRPYTPTSTVDQRGSFDLVIKVIRNKERREKGVFLLERSN